MTEHYKTAMEKLRHSCEMYNVGAMMPWMDYTPRALDEILMGWDIFGLKRRKRDCV